jgi:hypothetical protein
MGSQSSSTKRSAKEPKSDPAVSYDDFKEYEGRQYTGMKIGRSHKWHYDQGEWKEKKITPGRTTSGQSEQPAEVTTRKRKARRSVPSVKRATRRERASRAYRVRRRQDSRA